MPVRIILTDGDWSADTKIIVPRGTSPQTVSGLTNGQAYTVSNSATGAVVVPSAPYDPDAQALFARFATQPDAARKQLISDRFVAGKATTWWAKMDAIYMHAAHGPEAGRLNWLSTSYDCLPVNDPVFVVDRGYAGDGAMSYLDSQFNPATVVGAKFSQDSGSFGIRSNIDNNAAGSMAGFYDGTKGVTIQPRNPSNQAQFRLNQTNAANATNSDGVGLFISNRTAVNVMNGSKNGVVVANSALNSVAPANGTLRFGAISNDSLKAAQFSNGFIGAGLTNDELASYASWLMVYLTAVGVT